MRQPQRINQTDIPLVVTSLSSYDKVHNPQIVSSKV